ncbi:hypothetical protein [Kaarinaea lacus]
MPVVDKLARARQIFRSLTLFNLAQQYSKAYLVLVTITALVGYLYLLMFPAGALFGIYQFYLTVTAPFADQTILTALTWASVTLFCAGITHGIATIRFAQPEGIPLKRENAQLVFNKLEEIQQQIKWPTIHSVVLSRRFELSIQKTPMWCLPFWSRNTLVIGYPFMQTLSPEYFDCAITRKLLQYGKRRNMFYNWLSFLRTTWELYPNSFKQRNKVGDQLSYWFFKVYSRFYRYLALYVTQTDELYADDLALNYMNDRDVFETAESIRLVQFFLDQHFWPKLNELLARGAVKPDQIRPYEHLSKSTLQMLKNPKVNHWLKLLSLENTSEGSQEAPFAKRMHSMGYGKMIPPNRYNTTAAQYYFGPGNPQIVQRMNIVWAKHVSRDLARAHKKAKSGSNELAQQRLTVAF